MAKTKKEKAALKSVLIKWRNQHTIEKIDKPTRPNRAKSLGYKPKKGISLSRVKVKKGGRRRRKYGRGGRKPKKAGLVKFTPGKGLRWIAEERAAKKFPNMEVLNSYYVGEDGKNKWYEVIVVDPNNSNIKKDKNLNWICKPCHRKRVLRGKTSAGRKARK